MRTLLLAGVMAAASLVQTGRAATFPDQTPQATTTDRARPSSPRIILIEGLSGDTLAGVDGSTLRFTPGDDGVVRHIVSADGSDQTTLFAFLNRNLGTVRDGSVASEITGFFRRTDTGLELTYADGRFETIAVLPDGGVTMTLRSPGGAMNCMGWYPQGHAFSDSEKRIALAVYARKLGLPVSEKTPPASTSCAAPPVASEAVVAAKPAPVAPHHSRHTAMLAPPVSQAVAPVPLPPLTPVAVRVSEVHTIDPVPVADPLRSASTCLSVDSDGGHWGFRNGCSFDVRVAWCLKDAGPAAPDSCDKGPEAGLVAAKSFTPLVQANVLGGNGAERRFRWVACGLTDAAPAVEVHLDQTSPPSGRCIAPSRI